MESLESRIVPTADFRSITGVGNNTANPNWGAAFTQVMRNTTVGYADGVSSPGGTDRPSARLISNIVVAQGNQDLTSQHHLTDFVFQWGQFLDHDLDLTNPANPGVPFDISIPAGDPLLDPQGTGTQSISFFRSEFDPSTGTGPSNPRQQINELTSYIDGSMVYGSDATRASALRTGVGGRLKTSAGDLLPFNTFGLPNGNPAGMPDDQLFLAGDIRANETIALTSIQTLFMREHNYWADRIAAENPGMTDEDVYQRARQMVGAEIQVITYKEFLPAILGPGALSTYTGYSPSVNASVSNAFSTAAFRVGHTMLSSTLFRLDANGNTIPQGNVALRDAFFSPNRIIDEGGIDPVLRGLASHVQQEIDAKIVDDVRNFLFDNAPVNSAVDLAALNIQRGRDHGLPSYNQTRIDFGLPPVTSFAQITSDVSVQAALQTAYGSVDKVDAWVGGISEDHLSGSNLGPLFSAIWRDQFERARDGDRFWYQRVFSGTQLADLEKTTLADVIRRNTGITGIQENVFLDRAHQAEPRIVVAADSGGGPRVRVVDQTGRTVFDFFAFDPSFSGGVRVAQGDVNGDGMPDIIAATGPGVSAQVKVFSGTDLKLLKQFSPFEDGFTGGADVSAGDVNGDGFADVVVSAGETGGPRVTVFSGKSGTILRNFFAFDPSFRGGVHTAAGDLDGDGKMDLIATPGAGGLPVVREFNGATGTMMREFQVYDSTFLGGVFVAAGDCDSDGKADIITGAGPGGGPHVRVLTATGKSIQSFYAFTPSTTLTTRGVRVGCQDVDGDGRADILTAAGPGDDPVLECKSSNNLTEMQRIYAFEPTFRGGVMV